MYAIYTNIFGVNIPTELNENFQNAELSEMFDDLELPKGFECNVPYAGSDYADIHLGVFLSSSDGIKKPTTSPTKKQKELCKAGIKATKEQIQNLYKEWKKEFPENVFSKKDDDLVEDFLKELDNTLETYTAFSTS